MTSNRVFSLLVVDDDPLVHQALKMIVPSHWRLYSAIRLEALFPERFYHAAFVDMHLEPEAKKPAGPDVIRKLLHYNSQLEVVAMSGDLSRDLMELCLKAGAQRFLPKPLAPEEVLLILEKMEALWDLRNTDSKLSNQASRWVGSSEASANIKKMIASLKGETRPVLIEGETGTGKEVVARLLNTQEHERPFIAVNMASLPENLFESEMFGHVKGAFTGADLNKMGLIETAQGGDLFLDEIEALPMSLQAKLLRFLESGEIRRVGAKESQHVQTRVIAASNRPLAEMVKSQTFREDLYFRLSAQKILLPPLRQRLDDIALLAQFFLESERPRRNKTLTADGAEALKSYSWPGNVRELKRLCEQLSLVSPLPLIRNEDVQNWLRSVGGSSVMKANSAIELNFDHGLTTLLENYEAQVIRQCLSAYPDIEMAAQVLKISRSSLYKKIKDYNLSEEPS